MDALPPPSSSPEVQPGNAPGRRSGPLRRWLTDFLQNKAKVLADVPADSDARPPDPGPGLTVFAGAGAVLGGIAGFAFGFRMGGVSQGLVAVPFGVLVGGAVFALAAVMLFFVASYAWGMVAFPMRWVRALLGLSALALIQWPTRWFWMLPLSLAIFVYLLAR